MLEENQDQRVKVQFTYPHEREDVVGRLKPLESATDTYVVGLISPDDLDEIRRKGMFIELIR